MKKYLIKGGKPLRGEVKVSGAKNAALPAISATLLAKGTYRLKNVPRVRDVFVMLSILEYLGAKWEFEKDILKIDTSGIFKTEVPYELAHQMRASILFLGALAGGMGEGRVPMPGGCAIGKRPVDFHLKGLSLLGAEVILDHGDLVIKAPKLKGATLILDFPSVTTTENLLMASVVSEGETVIKNAAREPEVVFLGEMLKKMGAEIKGLGEDTIYIKGKKRLKSVEIEIIPDRIEAGTFMVIPGLFEEGEIIVKNIPVHYLETPIQKLVEIGLKIEKVDKETLKIKRVGALKSTKIFTSPFPGFPTDLQPQFAVLLTQAEGISIITENLFENRFLYVFELNRMGADIKVENRTAIIRGPTSLEGSPVKATDLRAGAALVLAGLCAKNTTTIYNVELIERGYENLIDKLKNLGAEITLESKK